MYSNVNMLPTSKFLIQFSKRFEFADVYILTLAFRIYDR